MKFGEEETPSNLFARDFSDMLLSDDLRKVIYQSRVDDLEATSKLLKEYVSIAPQRANAAVSRLNRGLAKIFFKVCLELNSNHLADILMKDEEFLENLQLVDEARGCLSVGAEYFLQVYLQMLYNGRRDEELIALYATLPKPPPKRIPHMILTTYATASCLRIGTREAFEKAVDFVESAERNGYRVPQRCLCIYAYLALQQGECELAYEQLKNNRRTNLSRNVSALSLAEMGYLKEALEQMSKDVELSSRPVFSKEVLLRISQLIEDGDDDDLKKELAKVFTRLEDVGEVSKDSLKEMLLQPIAKNAMNKV